MAYVEVKECLTNPRQLVKLIFLVICVCITIYQLSECVNKIINPPITSYYKFRYNETLRYPALTICRRPSFKKYLFPKYGVNVAVSDLLSIDVFKSFPFDNCTIEQFLIETSYDFDEVIPLYGYKGSGNGDNVDIVKSFFPTRGLCHTFIPKEDVDKFSVTNGYWFYLQHTTTEKTKDINGLSVSGFEIHIHDQNDVIREKSTSDTEYLYVETSENMFVTLSVQTYTQVSTKEEPCSTDPTYSKSKCEQECVHNAIAEQTGCTVPWLRSLKKPYPECKDYLLITDIGNLLSDFQRKRFLKNCYCPVSCSNSVYKYTIESRKECDALQAPASTINIYYPSNFITDLAEVVSYDWNTFLADVGGSLGFLLGLSVIGIVTVIENVLRIILGRSRKEKQEVKKEDELKLPDLSKDAKLEGESLKNVMEFVANCDMYHHLQQQKMKEKDKF